MFMKKNISLFLILFVFYCAFSQNLGNNNLVLKTEADIDQKLKKIETDPIDDQDQEEKILIQLKAKSEELDYDMGILKSGNTLMSLYLKQSRNKEAVDLGNQLKKIAAGKKDLSGTISNIYRRNALALGYLGLDEAGIRDFKSAIGYAKTIKDKNHRFYQLSLCYQNLNVCYNNKRFENKIYRDSIVYYLDKSNEMAKQIMDNNKTISNDLKYEQIGFNNMRLGIFYLEQIEKKGSLELAEKHLLEGLEIYENKSYNMPPDNKIMILNQVSWLYTEKKDYQKSIDFAKRAMALEKQYSDPYHRVESFEFLAGSYMEIGNKEQSKFYMDKYTFLKDSIAYTDKNHADTTMTKMVEEVDDTHKKDKRKLLWWVAGVFVIIIIITVFLWRRNNRIMRSNYEQMIEKLKNETPTQPLESETDYKEKEAEINDESEIFEGRNAISAETEMRILKRLSLFERSERFLRKDLTIGLLSGQLNTNSKYLSEIIKKHSSHNFNNYINNLRINYIVRKLYNEPKYREYKISYLAEECGYGSPQVFVIAFKKVSGVTPSFFIQNLKEDQVISA